jgi:hypothetical protein
MARFPCTRCGMRYRGPQQTAYPSIVDGTNRESEKMRLCPDCLLVVTGWMQERLVPAEDESPVELCSACGGPDPEFAVFVTLYRKGSEREDWYGRLHEGECHVVVHDALFKHAQSPEAA